MAQTTQTPNPPASAPPAANLVDPGTIQALKDMGAHLQTLKRFRVKTEITGERVLADGQKLQHTARAELDVARPDRLRASMLSPRSERLLYFDGKSVAFSTPAQKSYLTVEFNGNLGDLAEQLQDRFGVEIPLVDLFRWGTPRAPLDTSNRR